jgi:hypothetical protein
VTSDTGNMVLSVDLTRELPPAKEQATGTSGAGRNRDQAPLTEAAALAKAAGTGLVGRQVNLQRVKVASTAKDGGFWLQSGQDRLFVLPASTSMKISAGQSVEIKGVVLETPDEDVYVYAGHLKTAS